MSIGVFVVYIDNGSSVSNIPSKSCGLADENNLLLLQVVFYIYRFNVYECCLKMLCTNYGRGVPTHLTWQYMHLHLEITITMTNLKL
jgi:hypothetical protein